MNAERVRLRGAAMPDPALVLVDGLRSICERQKIDLEMAFRVTYRALRDCIQDCASPIEDVIAACLVIISFASMFGKTTFKFEQQKQLHGYWVDFYIEIAGKPFVVECDGHDYHERTKHQAAHDRARDRCLAINGIPTLRFTGSEICRSPEKCLNDICDFAFSLIKSPGAQGSTESSAD